MPDKDSGSSSGGNEVYAIKGSVKELKQMEASGEAAQEARDVENKIRGTPESKKKDKSDEKK
ncbi:hypothetical protein FH972_026570 [Carpinus fangiana]|uniref:Uncharacterized protein n=1 Tax=Carpinus fangiana TaxID=176857 RepID=A0A5N6L6W5_9ROSI|nr:hypothetical protein FH972_026570 [Carpinus fangiana]